MMKRMNTQFGVMAAEMCQMCKLQQKQCELQEHKDIEVCQKELQMRETALKVLM